MELRKFYLMQEFHIYSGTTTSSNIQLHARQGTAHEEFSFHALQHTTDTHSLPHIVTYMTLQPIFHARGEMERLYATARGKHI